MFARFAARRETAEMHRPLDSRALLRRQPNDRAAALKGDYSLEPCDDAMADIFVQQRRYSEGDHSPAIAALLCWAVIVPTLSVTDLVRDLREVYQRAQAAILVARILGFAKIMKDLTADLLGEWESEGGATIRLDVFAHLATPGFGPTIAAKTILVGTPNQIEWAEQIKDRVHREFDRVGMILNLIAAKQVGWDQTDTLKLVAILEE